MFEANALIRGHLHINPEALTDDEWVNGVFTAIWLENRQLEKLSKLIGG